MIEQAKEQIELNNYGDPIIVTVRQSSRAKYITIKIHYKGVELVLPLGTHKNKAFEFLFNAESRIREKLKSRAYYLSAPQKSDLKLPILGNICDLVYINCKNKGYVTFENSTITVYSDTSNAQNVLVLYLQNYLLNKIKQLLQTTADKHGFEYNKVSVKELNSKWGSCSWKGNLSFNWRIIFAPIDVLHYLIIHELCHLREMNHSKKYWQLVRQAYPNYQINRLWLKKYGHSLYGYLAL